MDSSPSAAASTARAKYHDKSAEFARLYYFFEKLTKPRSQGRCSSDESESQETVPEDIAPLLKNLSAILTKDGPTDGDASELGEAQVSVPEIPTTASAPTFSASASPSSPAHATPDHALTARPRRNTVAGSHTDAPATAVGRGIQARFPLREKRYPFTFKLLLHKLYDLEDWAAKVQGVLAASQERFRSLGSPPTADAAASATGASSSVGDNGNSPSSPGSPATFFGAPLLPPSEPLSPTRKQRAQSVSKSKVANDVTRSGPATPVRPQPSRAVKKRIVNRRRSTTGLGVGTKGEWMYDAAVSSVDGEVIDARGYDSLRRRKRVLSSVGFGGEGGRLDGQDGTKTGICGRRHLCSLRCH
ncbi:hypothetical protein BJY52DRAFT_961563 [Lactarius psammicola]|nr:hypothetical protein BJY52DRAFT_961563 [Lactarius psammicola]